MFSDKRHAYNWGAVIGCPVDRPMTIYTFDASKMQEEEVQLFKLSELMDELEFAIPDDKANQHVEVNI